MKTFDELVDEAERASIDGWDFTWLEGRAIEERPSWQYFDRVCERAGNVSTLLSDVRSTSSHARLRSALIVAEVALSMVLLIGAGLLLRSFSHLTAVNPGLVATEGFPPSVKLAAPRLRLRGARLVVASQTHQRLPFATGVFDLVISRHPIEVWWSEIARVLRPGGTYFAQHVGPHSLRSLSERLVGPLRQESTRDTEVERRDAENAGLVVQRMDVERPRTAFYDIGAVVYFLRLVPWIVPGFTVQRYRDLLSELHEVIQRDGVFETTASRTLVEAVKSDPTWPETMGHRGLTWRDLSLHN